MTRDVKTQLRLLACLTGITLLVGALSVVAYAIFFPPHFRGFGEVTAGHSVAGWIVNQSSLSTPVEVQLYVDGRFIAGGTADLPRPDVVAAGKTFNDRCGYNFPLPPLAAGTHEARVFATHKIGSGAYRTQQLIGGPLTFKVEDANSVEPR